MGGKGEGVRGVGIRFGEYEMGKGNLTWMAWLFRY